MLAAKPVNIIGVARDKVSAIAFFEPNEPRKSSLNESIGLTPAKRIKKLDIIILSEAEFDAMASLPPSIRNFSITEYNEPKNLSLKIYHIK